MPTKIKNNTKKFKGLFCYKKANRFYRLDKNKKLKFIEKQCNKCKNYFILPNSISKKQYCKNCCNITTNNYRKTFFTKALHPNIIKLKKTSKNCLHCNKIFISKGIWNRYCSVCAEKIETQHFYKIHITY